MAAKSSVKGQNVPRKQKLYSVGFSTALLVPEKNPEFDVWKLIKRNDGTSGYSLALRYRSKSYTTIPRRHRAVTPGTTLHRRRKNTDSAMTADSDERSSALSNVTENLEEPYLKDNYDYDAEDPIEPPQYPHLVHIPGTYYQELYLKACKQLAIPHCSMLYKQLVKDTIIVRRQHLGPYGMKAFATALVEMLGVHTLDLTDNALETKGAQYLAELLAENSFIKHLVLSDNHLGCDGVRLLADVIKKTDNLTSLDLTGNCLGDHHIEAVRPIIEETSNLKTLNLSHNDLGENGGRILAEALSHTDTLQHLDISWNHLRRKCIIKIAEVLAKNSSLLYLNMSWNGLHTTGCSAFGKALEKNTTLTELDVSNNRIDGKSLGKLVNGLKKNRTLTTIRVGQNPLNHHDALAMLTFIQVTPTSALKVLDMKNINVEEIFTDMLDEIHDDGDRDITVIHGDVLGTNLNIPDIDEGCLLEYDSWSVINQLGEVLGIDIYNILKGLSDVINLTPDQMMEALEVLQNPLSRNCTSILAHRLPRDHTGSLIFSQPNEKQTSVDHHGNHSQRDLELPVSRDDDTDDVDECVHIETEEEIIRNHVYKVFTRKLAGSTKYKRDLERTSQDGKSLLKQLVLERLEIIR